MRPAAYGLSAELRGSTRYSQPRRGLCDNEKLSLAVLAARPLRLQRQAATEAGLVQLTVGMIQESTDELAPYVGWLPPSRLVRTSWDLFLATEVLKANPPALSVRF